MRFFVLIALFLSAFLALTQAAESGSTLSVSANKLTVDGSSDCACSRIYKPVCGNDGTTYSSTCAMNCAAKRQKRIIKVAAQGRC